MMTLPSASTASAANVRAYALVSTCVTDDRPVGLLLAQRHDDAAVGATVGLADDDVLRHVHQTAGQVARVRGTQGGVSQTLRAPWC